MKNRDEPRLSITFIMIFHITAKSHFNLYHAFWSETGFFITTTLIAKFLGTNPFYISRIQKMFCTSDLPYLGLSCFAGSTFFCFGDLTLLHSERPKLYAFWSDTGFCITTTLTAETLGANPFLIIRGHYMFLCCIFTSA